jgi:hypothetical protein
MPAPVAGLSPTLPLITDALPASVMLGVPDNIAKGAAAPRFTVACTACAKLFVNTKRITKTVVIVIIVALNTLLFVLVISALLF